MANYWLFQSLWSVSGEKFYNWYHGHVDEWSCYADGSPNWARWILYVRSNVSCHLLLDNPRKEANVTGVVINCTLCWFGNNLVHSGNWQFNSSHTGCKIRWSGDWCYIPIRRLKCQWPVILSTELNSVCFRYKVAHSGNWQIWLQIFNAQDCPCEALGCVHK